MTSLPALSQTLIEPSLGLNYAWINYDRGAGQQYRPGYRPVIGVGFDFYVSSRTSFNPKVLYTVKGVFVRNGTATSLQRAIWTNYLGIPLEFRVAVKSGDKNSLKVSAGLNTGYWINQTSISRSPSGNISTAKLDFNDPSYTNFGRFNRLDLAARVGILVESPFAKGKMLWSVTYNHGFVPLYQPNNPPDNYHYDYHRWFQLMLVYPFKF